MSAQLPVADIIEWDVLNWSRLLKLWQPVLNQLEKNAQILAIGERNGGLSLWLALQGFRVTCTDRLGPSEHAKRLHEQYNVSHLVNYRVFDIVNGKLEDACYDIVIAKSVIGGLKKNPADKTTRSIAVQKKAVNNIYRLLKPGGYFLSAENLRGNWLAEWYRRKTGKDKSWLYPSLTDIQELFHSFSDVRVKTFGFLPTTFSHSFLNSCTFLFNTMIYPLLPASSNYIAFTTAKRG